MNPHFIFNSLNAIDNLIQTNQADKATTYLARFARLIRSVLEGAKNNVVPFAADFESMQLYLQMEQFRCNNKFTYQLEADDELMHSDYRVPAMLIQPFIENAIQHGLLNKTDGDKTLMVEIRLLADWIVYTISDNGVGRDKAKMLKALNRPEHQSDGIRISTERLNLFNKRIYQDAISIRDLYENGEPSGTMVTVKVDITEK
jgi:sensor histidine kinase YesM